MLKTLLSGTDSITKLFFLHLLDILVAFVKYLMSLFKAIGVFCPNFRLFHMLAALHAVLHKIHVPYVQQFYT